jgi:RimJ/RimL family protein N-acetyltransferase
VRTDRLVVRRFVLDDVEAALDYLGDPEVMEFVEPCFDHARATEFIQTAGVRPEPLVWAVELRSTRQLIGHVIFHPWPGSTAWELGWILRRDAWGNGFATELSAALIEYGFVQLGVDQIIAECVPTHHASIAAIERAGLTRSPHLDQDLPVWSTHRH